MISPQNKNLCCGCSACVSACTQRCISMKTDEEGFLYPSVDTKNCINCGLCERVCPFMRKDIGEITPLQTFAAKNLDNDVRAGSSSGGLFSLFAEKIIEQGGVVIGAQYDEEWNVVHGFATTTKELLKFRGSKFVQSFIGDTYRIAKEYLKKGRWVLFSGTPCQIIGLKQYLGKDDPHLLTIDFICHGVPSPKVWKHYLNELLEIVHKGNQKQFRSVFTCVIPETVVPFNGVLERISFRDKTLGWKKSCFALYFTDISEDSDKNNSTRFFIANDYRSKYFAAFNDNLIIRQSCFNCPAKGGRGKSDITLADFWGVEKELPDFSDDKGVSICMCNTVRGQSVYESLKVDDREVSHTQAISHNQSWRASLPPHPKREQFFKSFAKEGKVLKSIDKCLGPSMLLRFMGSMKIAIKRIISFHR